LDQGENLRIDWYWTAGDVGRILGDVINSRHTRRKKVMV